MDDQISRGRPVGGGSQPPGPVPAAGRPADLHDAGETAATFAATLVDEWATAGIRHAVLAPGSRSTPIALALDAEPRLQLHIAHDERVAAFMALGIAVATGIPAVVACTSGTAATHFHAAVVEADLAAVPMIVVTADRPPELHGVLAPQTIDQRDLYGRSVRWYCEPGPPAPGSSPWWRDLACDALDRSTGNLPGPVHLNLAFREPFAIEPGELPPADGLHAAPHRAGGDSVRSASVGPLGGVPWGPTEEALAGLRGAVSARRGLMVAGARAASGEMEVQAILRLAEALGWPVLADPTSGLRLPRHGVVSAFDSLLRVDSFASAHRPEVILHLGGLPASKVLREFCRDSGALQVGVDRCGRIPDPEHLLTSSLSVVPAVLAEALLSTSLEATDPGWGSAWASAEATAREAIAAGLRGGVATEPAVAADTVETVAEGTQVVVSSSMPVRDIEWFAAPREEVWVHANRGANGIDGVTSTAIGVALGSNRPTVLLTGDVAFLHDSSAMIALRDRHLPLTVVVLDNDGGGIFGFLPQAGQLDTARFERLFGTPHGTDLVSVASAFGLAAESVTTRSGYRAALAGAQARAGTRVIVVSTDRSSNVDEHRRLQAAVAEGLRS